MPLNKAQLMETPGGPGVVGAVKVGTGLLIAGDGAISVNPATQVTQLVAGSNITLNPSDGFGAVTITATAQGGVTQINAGTGITVSGNTGNVTVSVNASEVVTGIAAGSNISVTGNVGNVTLGLVPSPTVSSLLAATTIKANDVSIGLYTTNQGTKIIWNADLGTGATFFDNDRGGGAGGFRWREITAGGVVVQALATLSSFEGLIIKSPTDQFAIQLRPSGDIGVGPPGALQFGATGEVLTSQGAGNPATWSARDIPPGSVMLFYQAGAPTGWTQVTTANNVGIRIVSTAGGGTGGTLPFSTLFSPTSTYTGSVTITSGNVGNTSLTVAQLARHSHGASFSGGNALVGLQGANQYAGGSGFAIQSGNTGGVGGSVSVADAGNGDPHTHTLVGAVAGGNFTSNFDLQYVDVIIASKN